MRNFNQYLFVVLLRPGLRTRKQNLSVCLSPICVSKMGFWQSIPVYYKTGVLL